MRMNLEFSRSKANSSGLLPFKVKMSIIESENCREDETKSRYSSITLDLRLRRARPERQPQHFHRSRREYFRHLFPNFGSDHTVPIRDLQGLGLRSVVPYRHLYRGVRTFPRSSREKLPCPRAVARRGLSFREFRGERGIIWRARRYAVRKRGNFAGSAPAAAGRHACPHRSYRQRRSLPLLRAHRGIAVRQERIDGFRQPLKIRQFDHRGFGGLTPACRDPVQSPAFLCIFISCVPERFSGDKSPEYLGPAVRVGLRTGRVD